MFAAQLGRSRSGPPLRFLSSIFFRLPRPRPPLTSYTRPGLDALAPKAGMSAHWRPHPVPTTIAVPISESTVYCIRGATGRKKIAMASGRREVGAPALVANITLLDGSPAIPCEELAEGPKNMNRV